MHWLIVIAFLIPSLALADSWSGIPRVLDGDSLIFDGLELRLFNIDAFETEQLCRDSSGAEYRCGIEATKALVQIIAGRSVTCEGRIRDRYGRPLVRCRIGDLDLAEAMVLSGWAVAEWRADYKPEQEMARAARAGAWSGTFERPRLWRKAHPRTDRLSRP